MVTGSYTNVMAGGTALNVGGGMSGLAATLAPEMALAGFRAQDDAIEQALQSIVSDAFDPSRLLNELGTRWEIQRNFFRLRACCVPICPALDALGDALAVLRPKPDQIERIDVATFDFAAGMRNQDPPNYFGAKYSLPHAAAALVVNGHLRYESFTEAVVHDPAVAALRRRVHMTEDPQMSAALPARKPARVTLTLKDGRQTTHASDNDRRSSTREAVIGRRLETIRTRAVVTGRTSSQRRARREPGAFSERAQAARSPAMNASIAAQ
jgi:2-methylcitrate dehydratase PrpD